MIRALGITIPGLDPFLRDELMELLGREAKRVVPGKLEFPATPEEIIRLNYSSRSGIRFLVLLDRRVLDPIDLNSIKRAALEVDWSLFLSPESTFAVRAERTGFHDFTSVDAAATVGEAVIEHFSSMGSRIRVNLREPDVTIRVYISGNLLLIGLDTTGESLHRRGYRVFEHRTSLNPVIAYSLVRLSRWLDSLGGGARPVLIDPMCGGGTIPIEAALAALGIPPGRWRRRYPIKHIKIFRGISTEAIFTEEDSRREERNLRIICSDVSPKSIGGAMKNAASAGVSSWIEFRVMDAADLKSLGRIDYVATDPPFELRTGRNRRLEDTFRSMASALEEKLEGRFSAICAGPALPKLMRAMGGLRLIFNARILYGGVVARLLAYERRST